ncbi:hypothetical protein M422DRAFT_261030 [Sphaerobolus stellatus SS14]|uniref:Uncharacterized protein n=1 Tax=Sphaerobolus stellatus (strain SS14) TaxID=990650 RepID=A0A0C9VGE3_SPHS4|nr:hypothetical protein M422DRAFT_261030 [Sphaerobolus stellatus SS14]
MPRVSRSKEVWSALWNLESHTRSQNSLPPFQAVSRGQEVAEDIPGEAAVESGETAVPPSLLLSTRTTGEPTKRHILAVANGTPPARL